jgi:hypothetical protein
MQAYMRREHQGARFSFEDILNEELRLDRDDPEGRGSRSKARDR